MKPIQKPAWWGLYIEAFASRNLHTLECYDADPDWATAPVSCELKCTSIYLNPDKWVVRKAITPFKRILPKWKP